MRLRRVLTAQRGFTLIEVMVAALILIIGSVALATVLIDGQNEASSDVQESQLINVADQQIEQVRAAVAQNGFDALGMGSSSGQGISFPPVGTQTTENTWRDPDMFLDGGTLCFEIADNYDDVRTAAAGGPYAAAPTGFTPWSNCSMPDGEPLTILTGSPVVTVNPTISACSSAALTTPCTETLSDGPTVTIYTFVTSTYECAVASGTTATSCPNLNGGEVSGCTGANLPTSTSASTACGDARRVTVAVVPTTTRALSRVTPVYINTVFTNPNPSTNAGGSLGLTVNAGLGALGSL